ncbi:MAG: NACHT domain-containing protein, partial [Leptolyngbya sp. DLM2.Bin15]
ARDLLKSDRAIVLFDGFDEVPPSERADISHWLSQQMRHYPKTVFILTSRPAAYQKDFTAKRPTASFWVDTFNANQRQRFVEQWYTCQERLARAGRNTKAVQHIAKQKAASLLSQIASRPELNDLAGNALLLNMMARFHREKDGVELPNRKVELYQDICSMQLDRRPKARGIELWLGSSSQRQEVLQSVALAMMQRASDEQDGFKQVHHQALLDLLTPPLHERDASIDPEDFLAQIVDVSELMVDKEGRIYEFAHLSFQEFLAASELARLKREDLLYTQLDVDAWKPTLLLYADLVNPTHLIREALARQAVDLAYYIWRNTSKRLDLSSAEQRELEALKSTVQTSRFAQLETYLQQGQWEEADEETYRLMITAVGKEEGQWFKQEDLLNFPCDDLLAIDRLWMHHSQGHFGFSVQKTIYLSPKVGGNADGQYDKRSWNKFCHEVGWLLNSQFRVTYNTTSPKGHLPRWRQKGIIGEISLLFSHIQASEL